MKRFTKALSMLLAILMVVSLLPLSVIAEDIQNAVSTHTIHFNLNYNGAHKIPSQTVPDGECAVEPDNATRTGWILKYWYIKTSDGIEKYDFSQPVTKNLVLYARWDEDITFWAPVWDSNIRESLEKDSYTVTFNANGIEAEMPATQKIEEGQCASEPTVPTAEGYVFNGWFMDAACTKAFDFTNPIYSNITLYASWSVIDQTIPAPIVSMELVDGKPVLTWTGVENVDSYTVKRGIAAGTYTELATGLTDITYTDDTAENDTTYYYVVCANRDGKSSINSNAVVLKNVPVKPALFGRMSGDTAILTWKNANGAEWYDVYCSTASGGPYYSIAEDITGNSYSDNDLIAGEEYYYVITASNSLGTSKYSNEVKLGTDVEVEFSFVPELDNDGDGLTNEKELMYATDINHPDTDNDGLDDGQEIALGTDPRNPDTNGDGIYDGAAVAVGLDPLQDSAMTELTYAIKTVDGGAFAVVKGNTNLAIAPLRAVYNDNYLLTSIKGLIGTPVDFTSGGFPIDSAEITFTYTDEQLAELGYNEEDLRIFYVNPETLQLEELVSEIDVENNTVTATTTHFSTYLLADKNIPVDLSNVDIIFLIDESGSMDWNDPKKYRVDAVKYFIDKMDETSNRAGVIGFGNSRKANLQTSLTSDTNTLYHALNKITSNYGTYVIPAITEAVTQFEADSTNNQRRVVILLTDGEFSDYGDVVGTALAVYANYNIVINTVALGQAAGTETLKKVASNTKGSYFYINDTGNLSYNDVKKQIMLIYEKLSKQLTLTEFTEKNNLPSAPAVLEFSDLYTGIESKEVEDWITTASTNLLTGNYLHQVSDISMTGNGYGLSFERTYNSFSNSDDSILGVGYTTNYDMGVEKVESADSADAFIGTVTASALNVRSAAGTSNRIIGSLSRGTQVEILGNTEVGGKTWYKIDYNGSNGYIAGWYVDEMGGYKVTLGSGTRLFFTEDSDNGTILANNSTDGTFEVLRDGYLYTDASYNTWKFDSDGKIIRMADKAGNAVDISYSGDKIDVVTDEFGRTLSFDYNSSGLLSKITDSSGRSVSYSYDADKHLTKVVDLNGGTTSYTYHKGSGKLIKIVDANGNQVYRIDYDILGRIVRQYDANEIVKYYIYDDIVNDSENGVSARYIIDENGEESKYSFNSNLKPVTICDTLGNQIKYQYRYYNGSAWIDITDLDVKSDEYQAYSDYIKNNKAANIEIVTDKNGNSTTTEYDARGNIVRTIDAFGKSEYAEYDAKNNLVKSTDKNGNVTINTYDADSINLTESIDALGQTTSYSYYNVGETGIKVNGLVKDVTAPNGAVTSYKYEDSYNNTTHVTDALGGVTVTAYDEVGRPVSSTDANGNVTEVTYDAMGNPLTTTYADGGVVTVTYDALGNVLSQTDVLGRKTITEYDNKNRPIKITDADGNTITYTYDHVGNKLSEKNAAGAFTKYEYDVLHRLVAVTDALGNVTRYEYDANGNVVKITDALSRITTKTYDALNRVSKETSPMDAVTTYTYDNNGNVVKTTNALGYTVSAKYDKLNRQISSTNELGYTSTITYDDINNVVTAKDANGNITKTYYDMLGHESKIVNALGDVEIFEYDANGNCIKYTDTAGHITGYSYDNMNRVVKEVYYGTSNGENADKVNTYMYDLAGNVTEHTDPLGNKTVYAYDNMNRVISVTNVLGGTVSYTYDELGNQLTETDELGNTFGAEYDDLSRVIREYDALGNATSYTYDAVGNVIQSVNANGNAVSNTYDVHNNVIASTDAAGKTTRMMYDKLGRNTQTTDRNGNVTRYTYDKAGNLTVTTDPYNKTIKSSYDKVGNVISTTDAKENTVKYTYDALYRVVKETDQNGKAEAYTYDKSGNKISVTDRNGNETFYGYDDFNRLVSVTDALDSVTVYEYDLADNITKEINALGQTVSYEYDALYRVVKQTDASGNAETWIYDAAGNVLTATDRNGTETSYTYDKNGQVLSMVSVGLNYTYTYDAVGNILTSTDSIGTTTYTYNDLEYVIIIEAPGNKLTGYTYDAEGNMLSVTAPSGNVTRYTYDKMNRMLTVNDNGSVSAYEYDVNGNRSKLTLASGAYTTYEYDARNILIGMKNYTSETEFEEYSYVYDAAGLQTSKTEPKGTTTFAYNERNQVIKVTEPDGKVTEYAYDEAGNRTEQSITENGDTVKTTYTYDDAGRLVSTREENGSDITKTEYTYDKNGNQIQVKEDVNGSVTIYDYGYDALNQLTSYNDGETSVAYGYWATGLRATKTAGGKTVTYYYNGKTLLHEDSTGDDDIDYVNGINLVAQKSDETYYYMYNGHADVVQIHKLDAGVIVILNTYDYDIFGNVISSVIVISNAITYAGYYFDDETGYYYLRSRYYNPETARFITEDSFNGFYTDPLSLNKYTYCHNSPLTYYDPDGTFLKELWGGVKNVGKVVWGFGKGIGESVVETVKGVANIVAHPVETVKGLANAVFHPVQTIKAVGSAIGDYYNETWVNGGVEGKGQFLGRVVGEIGLAVIGTKGADKVAKGSKVAKAVDVTSDVGKVSKALDTIGDAGKVVNTLDDIGDIGKVSKTLDTVGDAGKVTRSISGVKKATSAKKYSIAYDKMTESQVINSTVNLATHNANSNIMALGQFAKNSKGLNYVDYSKLHNATYYNMSNAKWNKLSKVYGDDFMWKINQTYMARQMKAGKMVVFSHDPLKAVNSFKREVEFLKNNGYSFYSSYGDFGVAIPNN